MIVDCPHCGKQLKLGDKIRESVRTLEPGRRLKIKCVHCGTPFALDQGMESGGEGRVAASSQGMARIRPPGPPDTDWLKDGVFEEKDVVEDIPRALVLMPDIPGREQVVKAASAVGYRVEQEENAVLAMERMLFVNYAAVFLHSRFEPGGIATGVFHRYMMRMNMTRRRYIFYVLIGEQFSTLYDLQAMTCSANIVVNDSDIPYIGTILKKAIPEYEALFGPIMEELRIAGRI